MEEIENMARTYNFDGNQDTITFNIGSVSLDFNPTDEKSKAMVENAEQLKKKSEAIDKEDGDEWQLRREIKELLDESFTLIFDGTAPQKLYKASGENTISYLRLFLQIAEAIKETNEEKQNDETFKKYLAE